MLQSKAKGREVQMMLTLPKQLISLRSKIMLTLPKQLISLSSDDALLKRWWGLGGRRNFPFVCFQGKEESISALRWGDTWHSSHSPSFSTSHLVALLSFSVKKSCLVHYPSFLISQVKALNCFPIPMTQNRVDGVVTHLWLIVFKLNFNCGQFGSE